ncbi:reducing type I polyketide synthase [Hypoxylon sp. NC1633]|nr:reducing type I polyketide synthase [Hypoxylon sp. NC1633]
MACRLPGHCHNPRALWKFMKRGGVAETGVPESRFNLSGHYDGSQKRFTMKTPGGMFLEDTDPADFDAQFFNINRIDASSMDPQQRVLMEVVYECLENAGIPLESLAQKRVGCLVGASAVDYHDMTCRDPEDRTESPTMGSGRALLSNRISHFLNVHGPSITLDTACSSTLIALDTACLYLHANQCDAVIVGGVNMYFSPERNQDMGAMRPTASSTGRCHTFSAHADGYTEAEAVNAVFLRRLDDAVRDGNPIRAIIRGTAINSAGRTPGIASPSPEAQAMAIRAAYQNAGFTEDEFADTGYLECHGTGTLAGDPAEVEGLASVFAKTRPARNPLVIGSVKSNIGHSEAAAGLSGLIKAVLAIEHATIPGTATFVTPNPHIDFAKSRVLASLKSLPWPTNTKLRAGINSFGFGGANAHAVIEDPQYLLSGVLSQPRHKSSFLGGGEMDDLFGDDGDFDARAFSQKSKPKLLVLSANDEASLKIAAKVLSSHLLNPGVNVSLLDLVYTLSEKRSKLYCRGFSIVDQTRLLHESVETRNKWNQSPKIGFVFTGQGAQWPQMGKQLLESFSLAAEVVEQLDAVLQGLPSPPPWSLKRELTEERDAIHLRNPEFSQPLVTALQLATLAVLRDWGIYPGAVVGHSSGEIAAACASGYLSPAEAILIAYFRGQAGKHLASAKPVGMLAVGVAPGAFTKYIDEDDDLVQIACYNSSRSLTVSGTVSALERLRDRLQADGHFARILQVDYAYHSKYMSAIGKNYLEMLHENCSEPSEKSVGVSMFSSVTGELMKQPTDHAYWLENMVSPVRFDQAASKMMDGKDGVNFLVEIGPSNALKGPISQIIETFGSLTTQPIYTSTAQRGPESLIALYRVAGTLYSVGGDVNLGRVNEYHYGERPCTLIDLPNYSWNHSTKYWYESPASRDWRNRPFVRHDLLGTKILGSSWESPVWRNSLRLNDSPWLKDHKIGDQVVFPGAGYVAMAIEAIFQASFMTIWHQEVPDQFSFRLRDVKFFRALVLDETYDPKVMLSLAPLATAIGSWYAFKISSTLEDMTNDHASGLIKIEKTLQKTRASADMLAPLRSPVSARLWYKAMRDAGFNFGPSFQKHLMMEYTTGQRNGRSTVSLEPPLSAWEQSFYTMHPACMDGCFQTVLSSSWQGDRSAVDAALVPLQISDLVIPWRAQQPHEGIALARSEYVGVGRREVAKSYLASTTTYDPVDGSLLLEMKGLRYTELDTTNSDSTLDHVYRRLHWEPSMSLLSEGSLRLLVAKMAPSPDDDNPSSSVVQKLLDMALHENQDLNVLEADLSSDGTPTSCWLKDNKLSRIACSRYQYAANKVDKVVSMQTAHGHISNAEFVVLDFSVPNAAGTAGFDVAIVRLPSHVSPELAQILSKIRTRLNSDAIVVFLDDYGILKHEGENLALQAGLSSVCHIGTAAWARATPGTIDPQNDVLSSQDIFLIQLSETRNEVYLKMKDSLSKTRSWNIQVLSNAAQAVHRSRILILDEAEESILTRLNSQQLDALKLLMKRECDILWVTAGGQLDVINPNNAAANGLFRVLRNEEPLLRLINLDVESITTKSTVEAVDRCLRLLCAEPGSKAPMESEFVERGGILHVGRIVPDDLVNTAKDEQASGGPAVNMDLHAAPNCVRLRAERIGNIDSLHYGEVSSTPLSLPPNSVEIEIYASGVNFKEIAVTVGIVPENEHLLGGEGAGLVRRVAPDVSSYKPGQRVVFFEKGSFANRIIVTTQRVQPIPDSMSFEEAATIPCVFMTSMYALYRLAGLKRDQSVLIHSATGGVGISAIQLAQNVGAEVFATAGTQEKRNLLKSQFGIPDSHIFSSRSADFGEKITSYTSGKGVDVILNSLTGELLDASWRIIADGGVMIEIGKKDILDRSSLAMEPFDRNASFRALDLSHKEITDDTIASLLTDIFTLVNQKRLRPISPMTIFSFNDTLAAFRLIRSGRHMGKVVISDGPNAKIEVTARKAPIGMKLRHGVCYLVVGGLKGLCSSLALYLAQNGARHLAVISRSGHDDARSLKVAEDIAALGCHVHLLRADVCEFEEVNAVFDAIPVPVAGIIQGAMVLRDRMFEQMSLEDYHAALRCKVQGTWNLHHAAMDRGLNLDFFTLLSSISGLCGSKGQANYAAANAFLDAFATYRRRLGLVACSVNLGVIQDVGYMAEKDDLRERYDDRIWHVINERLLRKIFSFTVMQQHDVPINDASASHIITGIRAPQPSESHLLRDARFAGLWRAAQGHQSTATDGDGGAKEEVQALLVMQRSKAEPATMLKVAVDVLSQYLMKSLRLSEALDAARPLSAYGIDSLAAVEFRNWLRIKLGVALTTLDIVNAPSLVSVCEKTVGQIAAY